MGAPRASGAACGFYPVPARASNRGGPAPCRAVLPTGAATGHDQGNALRFLHDLPVEPTNNAAERAPRPAVAATDGDAERLAAFVSPCQTCGQRDIQPVAGFIELFRYGQPVPPYPAANHLRRYPQTFVDLSPLLTYTCPR